MKYFTKQMWAGWQNQDSAVVKRVNAKFKRDCARYQAQLKPLLPRLSKTAARFFTHHSLHDGTLLGACIGDAVDQRGRPKLPETPQTTLALTVLVGYSKTYLYHLTYRGIRDFCINPDSSLFPVEGSLFGDWGYDELTPEDEVGLRHSILFQTGTEMSIVFTQFTFRRERVSNRVPVTD